MNVRQYKIPEGTDLLKFVENIAKTKGEVGYILGIVGNLSSVAIKCPGSSTAKTFNGVHEIISLNGFFSENKTHLHLSFSNAGCNVFGGHLIAGTILFRDGNILIGFLTGEEIKLNSLELLGDNDNSNRVKIAVLSDCPWSKRAMRLLNIHSIPYDVEVIFSQSEFNEIKNKSDSSIFPQIFIDDKFIGGYRELEDLHSSGDLSKLI